MVTFEKEIEQAKAFNARNIILSGCLYNPKNDRCIKVQFESEGFFILADFVIDLAKKISTKDYLRIRQRFNTLHLQYYNQFKMTDYNLNAIDKEHVILFAVCAFLEDAAGGLVFDSDIDYTILPYIDPLLEKLKASNVQLNSIG